MLFFAKKNWIVASSIVDKWKKYKGDACNNDNAFVPVVGDIREVKDFLQTKVNDANNNTVKSENDKRADGDGCDKARFDAIDGAEKIGETIN